jgi:TPP-dependent pyruvate/acetoin dehydrogenase alpha subunit
LGTEADFKQMEKDVIETVTECVRFADESPFPKASSLHEDVYVE